MDEEEKEYEITFHGSCTVTAASEEEARKAFYRNEEYHAEYEIDGVEEQ